MEFTFFASHMISILQGTLAKSRDPFRFQQRGKYTIPAVHCQRGERSPSASRLGQRHLFQERRSHWTLAQITWDMEDLCPNRGNPPKRPSGDVSTLHREGRHPGIVRRDWWSVTWGFFWLMKHLVEESLPIHIGSKLHNEISWDGIWIKKQVEGLASYVFYG